MMFEQPEGVNAEPIVIWLTEQEYKDAKACIDEAWSWVELACGNPVSLEIVAVHVAEKKLSLAVTLSERERWEGVLSYMKMREHFKTIEIVTGNQETKFKYDNGNVFPF